jgi:hypothetical protein
LPGLLSAAQPEGNVKTAAGLGHLPDCPVCALAVSRFEQRKKQLVGYWLVLTDAEQASCGIGPFQLPRGKVEIPGSDAESLHLELKMLF